MKRLIMPPDRAVSRKTFASRALSLAAAAAVIGPLVYVAVTLLHPPGQPANDHPVVFREYAMAQTWTAIHLVQLAGLVVGLVGIAGLAASMLRLQENGRLLALLAVGLAAASIPIADLDLDTLMGVVERLAEHDAEGRLTLLRFAAGWKVALGTPEFETEEGRQAVLRLPTYSQLKDGLVALLVRRRQMY